MRVSTNVVFFDPNQGVSSMAYYWAWMDGLFQPDWTINPTVQDYKLSYPSGLYVGESGTKLGIPNPGQSHSPCAPGNPLAEHPASKWPRIYGG